VVTGARAALALACGVALQAQWVPPEAVAFALLGEFQVGVSQVPADLKGTLDSRSQRALGWSFPLRLAPRWQLRPRYDDTLFRGLEPRSEGAATVRTTLKLHHLGTDLLFSPGGERWQARPTVYVGGGLGLVQTWHERDLLGVLQGPGLPAPRAEETWSPAVRLLAGLQVTPWLALEAQFQSSSHRFEGGQVRDAHGTVGVRFWPAAAFAKRGPRL